MATQIRCNGVSLAVEDGGGGGPAVLFSHGLLYSRRMWDAQVGAPGARTSSGSTGWRWARLVQIPRAGHMSAIDAPEAVTAELRAFLASVE